MFKEYTFDNDVDKVYPTIITFFTDNWRYKKHALEMRDTCNKFKLNYYIAEYQNLNNYLHNTRLKPKFIQQALTECRTDVLWIDADGILSKRPDRFVNIKSDFAAKIMPSYRTRKWHVGTMYFKYNTKIMDMVDEWVNISELPNTLSDEDALDKLYKSGYFDKNSIKAEDIPATYFELLNHVDATPNKNSVISHRISQDPNKLELKKRGIPV